MPLRSAVLIGGERVGEMERESGERYQPEMIENVDKYIPPLGSAILYLHCTDAHIGLPGTV